MERTFRQLAADKELEFNVEFDDDLPATIRTDEKRLQQVVLNLLSNAFKFTAQGSVTLAVSCAEGGWSTNHPVLRNGDHAIEIAVTDTGIGIPEDKQKLIFEAFQQADGTTSRKYGGTGLGLSISREIARLLGGELQVRSKPGEGSTFTLFVPLEAAARRRAVDRRLRRATTIAARSCPTALPTALEVTDDRDRSRRRSVRADRRGRPDLRRRSCSTSRARPGSRASSPPPASGTLALARKLQPDAITLDLGLADIDGFVLLDLLKHDPETSAYPDPCHLGRRAGRLRRSRWARRRDREAGRATTSWPGVPRSRPSSRARKPKRKRRGSRRRRGDRRRPRSCPSWPAPKS